MGYVAVGALGAIDTWCPSLPGAAGKSLANCNGTEVATNCPSVCCDVNTWNNGTYAGIKGSTSLQFFNERRVRAALQFLLSSTPNGSMPISDVAYDAGAAIPSTLAATFQQALNNFNLLFPASRWTTRADCVKTACQTSGFYSCYLNQPSSASAAQLNLLKQLTGTTVTGEQWVGAQTGPTYQMPTFAEVQKGAAPKPILRQSAPLPSQAQAWYADILLTIKAVPGGGAAMNYQYTVGPGTKPDPEYLVIQGGDVVGGEIQGGTVAPSPWLSKLIRLLVPATTISPTAAITPGLISAIRGSAAPTTFTPTAAAMKNAVAMFRGATPAVTPLSTQTSAQPQAAGGFSMWWVLGGLALAGAGAYYFTHR